MEATAVPDLVPELRAIVADGRARCGEYRRVLRSLWPDRDDAAVMSEIVWVLGQLRQAEMAVAGAIAALARAEGAER